MEKKTRGKSKLLIMLSRLSISILIIVVIVAIVLIGIFAHNRKLQEENSKTVDIWILLDSSVTTAQEQNIRSQIEIICDTTDIKYTSKDEALENMKKYLEKEHKDILKVYDGENNILSSQFTVEIKLMESSKIIDDIKNIKGVKDVRTMENITDNNKL